MLTVLDHNLNAASTLRAGTFLQKHVKERKVTPCSSKQDINFLVQFWPATQEKQTSDLYKKQRL